MRLEHLLSGEYDYLLDGKSTFSLKTGNFYDIMWKIPVKQSRSSVG